MDSHAESLHSESLHSVDSVLPSCERARVTRRCPAYLILALAASLLAPGVVEGRDQDPWIGTWELNAKASTQRTAPSPYKQVLLRIEPEGDGLAVIYDMVGVRGGVTHMEWIGALDGRDYAMQGVDYVLTNAYRRIDDRSYEIVIKVDGQVAATAVAAVSTDGRSLIVDTAERGPGGDVVQTRAVYDRRAP